MIGKDIVEHEKQKERQVRYLACLFAILSRMIDVEFINGICVCSRIWPPMSVGYSGV